MPSPEYRNSVGECSECAGRMLILFYVDGQPKRNPDRRIRTKCGSCGNPGSVTDADARSDVD
jgi:hypothetical protein